VLVDDQLIRDSLDELAHMARWVRDKGSKTGFHLCLIGGWAVHAYNPWYGSQDIDLLSARGERKALMHWLRSDRGFVPRRDEGEGLLALRKTTAGGSMIVEFLRADAVFRFEGRRAEYPLRSVFPGIVWRKVEGVELPVPVEEKLFILKAKAAWDRSWRLDNGRSDNAAYERGKLAKDMGDLLALLDPTRGPQLDFSALGKEMGRYPFLLKMLQREELTMAGANRYGLSDDAAREWFSRLAALL
jgi:hypothetical protein